MICLLLFVAINNLVLFDITTSCAKTAEPIEMPFGVWTRVGRRNHALGGARDPPREGARRAMQPFVDILTSCYYYCFFTPLLNSQGMKKLRCAIRKSIIITINMPSVL